MVKLQMIDSVFVVGERCSGTNYLVQLILTNFNVDVLNTNSIDNNIKKHFFTTIEQENKLYLKSPNTLFICIVRNPVDWMNSLFRDGWFLPQSLTNRGKTHYRNFLNNEFYSIVYSYQHGIPGNEIMADRHPNTNRRYRNVFEARYTKINYMRNKLPKMVNKYLFLRYEDLINNFEHTMERIKFKGLAVKKNIGYPQNVTYYKHQKEKEFEEEKKNKIDMIPKEDILNHSFFNKEIEASLEYV